MINAITLLIAFAISLAGCAPGNQPPTKTNNAPPVDAADTVYTNGMIYTVNEAQPWAEAVAIKDGRFLAVGSAGDVEGHAGAVITLAYNEPG